MTDVKGFMDIHVLMLIKITVIMLLDRERIRKKNVYWKWVYEMINGHM